MQFAARAMPITRAGLSRALAALDLAPGQAAALWAVFEVETAGLTQGFGFRADRRPQILFERHKFREFTNRRFDAGDPDISGPQGGYGALGAQYVKLEKAIARCEEAGLGAEPALKSASWGIGQVMGFNHLSAGFPTAETMVGAMVEGEDAQLLAMTGFLNANGLSRYLGMHNWVRFARGYNGPGFAANHYDVKLAEQYARFSSGSMPNLEVRTAQAALLLQGFAPGKIDGVIGGRTRIALSAYQTGHGLSVTGELDSATYDKLFTAAFSA